MNKRLIAGVSVAAVLTLGVGVAVAANSPDDPLDSVRVTAAEPTDETTPPGTTVTTLEADPTEPTTPPTIPATTGDTAPAAPGTEPPPTTTVEPAPAFTPGATIPEPAPAGPVGCVVSLNGSTVTKSECPDVTTLTVRWYFRCGPGFDVPATLPSGRVITTCPTLILDVALAFSADQVGVGEPPPDANCFTVYLPEPAVFRGTCEN